MWIFSTFTVTLWTSEKERQLDWRKPQNTYVSVSTNPTIRCCNKCGNRSKFHEFSKNRGDNLKNSRVVKAHLHLSGQTWLPQYSACKLRLTAFDEKVINKFLLSLRQHLLFSDGFFFFIFEFVSFFHLFFRLFAWSALPAALPDQIFGNRQIGLNENRQKSPEI